jgi:hypothetical protein
VRPDDGGIDGETALLRALVDPNWWKVENDVSRVTSFAFTSGDEPSCYIDTPERRRTMAERYPGVPFGRFQVSVARSLGFHVTSDPDGDPDGSPEHVLLTSADPQRPKGKHQRCCRALAAESEFLSSEQFLLGIS